MCSMLLKKKRETDRDPEERGRKEGRKRAKGEKKGKKKEKKKRHSSFQISFSYILCKNQVSQAWIFFMPGFCSSGHFHHLDLTLFTLLVLYWIQFCYFLYVVLGMLCTSSIYLNLSQLLRSGSQGLHDWKLACLTGLAQFPVPNLQIKTYSLPRDYHLCRIQSFWNTLSSA